MKTLTLSAIVGGLILAGIVITVHSCNSSNPKPDVAKPTVGVSGHDSGTVAKTPKPEPNTVSVLPAPPRELPHQPTLTPTPSLLPKPKPNPSRDRDNCYLVRIPAPGSSPPTITPIYCN